MSSSHYTDIPTRLRPAKPVSVSTPSLPPPPAETSSVATNYKREITLSQIKQYGDLAMQFQTHWIRRRNMAKRDTYHPQNKKTALRHQTPRQTDKTPKQRTTRTPNPIPHTRHNYHCRRHHPPSDLLKHTPCCTNKPHLPSPSTAASRCGLEACARCDFRTAR